MADKAETVDVKRQQRQVLLVGVIVAAIPFVCQLLMLIALESAPAGTFPTADRSFTDARFWPIQIVLLCVSVSGNAMVDCVRFLWTTGRADRTALGYLLWLFFVFFIESLMFSVTLLAPQINWSWLAVMTVFGAVNLLLAYQLSMEIAGKD
jgi:hypothetical protein